MSVLLSEMLRPPVLYSDYVNNFLLAERYKAQGGKKMENVWGCLYIVTTELGQCYRFGGGVSS